MTPKRYLTFACLTALIQGGVIASQSKPSELRTAGMAMGSVQSINLTISTPTAQSVTPAALPVENKPVDRPLTKAKDKLPTAEPKTPPLLMTKTQLQATIQASPDPRSIPDVQRVTDKTVINKVPEAKIALQPTTDQQQQREIQTKQGVAQTNIMLNRPTFSSPPSQPIYPKLARKRGFEGTVTVEVMFNQIGEQLSLTLIDSSGFSLLDKAALNAVEKWQFSAPSPQTAYAYTVRVPVKFALN
ncbi:TonB family protein [Shewanella sp. D64]|uniref:energy transducer TonB n=1 Tax=unclassified Shewanella TaxID=196818 RepID=UPI0022BA44E0|nr:MULTISPECIES: energy transducer TonB [unclassified Shewanella]MEC4724998.1 TonB family protein [Shewanella sp. D64]MEC4736899.1 TonB family protein [Shewanella sp. E94]WBJ96496.1 TonB family protein [Shewanella sp. MTB7]